MILDMIREAKHKLKELPRTAGFKSIAISVDDGFRLLEEFVGTGVVNQHVHDTLLKHRKRTKLKEYFDKGVTVYGIKIIVVDAVLNSETH